MLPPIFLCSGGTERQPMSEDGRYNPQGAGIRWEKPRRDGGMVWHVDLYFLANCGMDYVLLWATAGLTGRRRPWWRLGLGAAAGGSYALLVFLPGTGALLGVAGRVAASIGMLLVAFYPLPRAALWRLAASFYGVSFAVAGAMLGVAALAGRLRLPLPWYLTAAGLAVAVLGCSFLARRLERRDRIAGLVSVEVVLEGKCVRLRGLVDTAHRLVDPLSRRPVVVAELPALVSLFPPAMARFLRRGDESAPPPGDAWTVRLRVIPFASLGQPRGMLLAFRPDALRCGGVEQEALVAVSPVRLSPEGRYQALLPTCLAGELPAA